MRRQSAPYPQFFDQHQGSVDARGRVLLPQAWRTAIGKDFIVAYNPALRSFSGVPTETCQRVFVRHRDFMQALAPRLDYGHMTKEGRVGLLPDYRDDFLGACSEGRNFVMQGQGRFFTLKPMDVPLATNLDQDDRLKAIMLFKFYEMLNAPDLNREP